MSPARELRRDELFDLLVNNPCGLTVIDMTMMIPCTHPQANNAISDLREYLGEYDDINLICDPQSKGDRWIYRLVGTLDESRGWVTSRINDAESRIRSIQGVMAAICRSIGGRSMQGRKAKTMERSLRRLVEDIDLIMEDAP